MIENYNSVNNTLKPDSHSAKTDGKDIPKNVVNDVISDAMNDKVKDAGIEFRCPQCFKLYKALAKDMYSSQPQFECVSCHAQFTFDYPPRNKKAVYTRTLYLPQVSKLAKVAKNQTASAAESLSVKTPELKVCPKCQATNPRGMTECYRCGVVFAKYEAMQNDPRVGMNFPSLMKMWQELLGDYTNITKHLAFVDRCEELHALPFALKKYKDLREVQPQDSLAHQMLNSVLVKSLSRQASSVAAHPWMHWPMRVFRFISHIPWSNLLRMTPVVLALFLTLFGLVSHVNRNLAGIGVALLVLVLGFTYFLKGSVHWRHFWR